MEREQQPRKRSFIRELGPIPIAISLGIVILIVIGAGIWFWGVLVEYIGPKDNTDRKDVVQVFALIVAGVVGFIGAIVGIVNLSFGWRNLQQQIDLEEERRQSTLRLEERRRESTLELETQRSQDAALQAYFEQMGGLLTEHNLLHADREDIRQLAEAQTLTVVARLDGSRKRSLVRFLHEAGLIHKDKPTVGLSGADLRLADLSGADLSDADLNGADLSETYLRKSNLSKADLSKADLSGADLSEANGWTEEQLSKARTLAGATMPDGQILQGDEVPHGPTFEEWQSGARARAAVRMGRTAALRNVRSSQLPRNPISGTSPY